MLRALLQLQLCTHPGLLLSDLWFYQDGNDRGQVDEDSSGGLLSDRGGDAQYPVKGCQSNDQRPARDPAMWQRTTGRHYFKSPGSGSDPDFWRVHSGLNYFPIGNNSEILKIFPHNLVSRLFFGIVHFQNFNFQCIIGDWFYKMILPEICPPKASNILSILF